MSETRPKFTPHYSGKQSRAFWKRINALPEGPHDTAYALGVLLQEVEHRALRLIESVEGQS